MIDPENMYLPVTLCPGTAGLCIDGKYFDFDECMKLRDGGSFTTGDGFVVRFDKSRKPIPLQPDNPFCVDHKFPVIIEKNNA